MNSRALNEIEEKPDLHFLADQLLVPPKSLVCITDNTIQFTKRPHSDICDLDHNIYRCSSNNQLEHSNDTLLAAEYAVFAGNLLKHLLGKYQPIYYLAQSTHRRNPKYYRVCNQLENYQDWDAVTRVDTATGTPKLLFQWDDEEEKDISELNILNLTSILIASHFIGEADWNEANFGFVK